MGASGSGNPAGKRHSGSPRSPRAIAAPPRTFRSSASLSSRRGAQGNTAGPVTISASAAGSFHGPMATRRSAVRCAREPTSRPRSRTSART